MANREHILELMNDLPEIQPNQVGIEYVAWANPPLTLYVELIWTIVSLLSMESKPSVCLVSHGTGV